MSLEVLRLPSHKQYCYQVLGIREILIPESHSPQIKSMIGASTTDNPQATESSWAWQGDPRASFFMYIPEPMSGELKDLWKRILAALKKPPVIYLTGKGSEKDLVQCLQQFSAHKGLVFGPEWAEQLGINNFNLGHHFTYAEVEWKMTYRLAELVGPGREVEKKKKEAWAHLREIIL